MRDQFVYNKKENSKPIAIDDLMDEARRRYENFGVRDGKTLEQAWIGLGFASEYKSAVEAGLMRRLHNNTPRVLGWYQLTEAGVAEYLRRFGSKATSPNTTGATES